MLNLLLVCILVFNALFLKELTFSRCFIFFSTPCYKGCLMADKLTDPIKMLIHKTNLREKYLMIPSHYDKLKERNLSSIYTDLTKREKNLILVLLQLSVKLDDFNNLYRYIGSRKQFNKIPFLNAGHVYNVLINHTKLDHFTQYHIITETQDHVISLIYKLKTMK